LNRASNGTSLMQKFHWSQRESTKEVDVQNLPGCCANTFWVVGPTGGPCGPTVLFTRVNSIQGYCSAAPRGRQGLRPLFRYTPCLFYKLALATTEQPHSAAFVYCRLHLRVILRLLASNSYSFVDCAPKLIFLIRPILLQQGR
jgi:hypothetical protein